MALGMSVNAACTNYRPDPVPGPSDMAGQAPGEVWVKRVGRGISGPLAIAGNRLWLGGSDRLVRSVSLDTPAVVWATRLPGAVLGGVTLRDSVLFLATSRPEGRIIAIDPRTGAQLWRASAGDVITPPGISGDLIAIVNRRGELVAFHTGTGRLRWRRIVGISGIAPAAAGDAFVVATSDSLLRIETSAGRVTHRRRSPGSVLAEWRPVGRFLVAPTGDSTIVAINPVDLTVAWVARLDAPVTGALGSRGDTIWAVTRIGSIYRIALPSTNAVRVAALAVPISSGIVPLGDTLVVGGADGVLRAIGMDGRPAWRLTLSWDITVAAVPLPDGFLALGGDGDLHRYRQ